MLMVRRRLRLGARGQWAPTGTFFTNLERADCGKLIPLRGSLAVARFRRPASGARLQWRRALCPSATASPEDFESLWRMDQECFAPGIAYSREELKVYMRRRGAFTLLAAGDDGATAGFIVVHGGPTGHVITIDVIKAARRSGVGSQLLEAAEERLRAAGSRAVGLETAVDNLPALSFYKRHGYSVVRDLATLLLERRGRVGAEKRANALQIIGVLFAGVGPMEAKCAGASWELQQLCTSICSFPALQLPFPIQECK